MEANESAIYMNRRMIHLDGDGIEMNRGAILIGKRAIQVRAEGPWPKAAVEE